MTRIRRELTGALVTMRDKRREQQTTGPVAPWWWTDDDDASQSNMLAMRELHDGG